MKYLLQAIDAQRNDVRLSDHELRDLLVEVRSGKDDRIEFIDAMLRLLDELKSSEHATAFLTKVAKRDAPDYYDVIKNPMDLGTMMRNVKSGRYKSKAQFTRDLDLIWDNCLTYNSEPTHPLRRSVQVLRAKANHLLTYVNDTNDVKEALNQWQASLPLPPSTQTPSVLVEDMSAPASQQAETPASSAAPHASGASRADGRGLSSLGKVVTADAESGVDESDAAAGKDGTCAESRRRRRSSTSRAAAQLRVEEPFEQQPALMRFPHGMDTFARLNAALHASDKDFAEDFMLEDTRGAGPSSRPMQSAGVHPSAKSSREARQLQPAAIADSDLLRTIKSSNHGGLLHAALTTAPAYNQKGSASIPDPLRPADEAGGDVAGVPDADADKDSMAASDVSAWWNSTTHPTLLPSGIPDLSRSEQGPPKRLRRIGARLSSSATSKRHKQSQPIQPAPPAPPPQATGDIHAPPADDTLFVASAHIPDNVETIVKLRRTHAKYGSLIEHIESGEPVPADLVVVSSDEEGEDDRGGRRNTTRQRRRMSSAKRRAGAIDATTPRRRRQEKTEDVLEVPEEELRGNPFPKIGSDGAAKILGHRVQLVLAHAGFEGSQRSASDVVTDVAGEFFMNLGRTLRSYVDRFAREMSVEELMLHTLYENGGADVRTLESYVRDDVQRHGHKMAELLRKLRTSYRETLSTTDLVMADEVAFFADGAAGETLGTANPRLRRGMQSGAGGAADGDDDGEQIVRGGLALDVADEDFFGFKDMGLDAELGVDVGRQLASLPSRMFQRRAQGDATAGGRGGGGGMATGKTGSKAGGAGGADGGGDDEMVDFPPPPPFVPLSEAAISAQIGIVQSFYRELLRTRGQWVRDDEPLADDEQQQRQQEQEQQQAQEGETTAGGEAGENDEERQQREREDGAYLVLPDEEQERQRYKVPPTGKMPRRAMMRREGGGEGATKGASAGAGAGAAGGTKPSAPTAAGAAKGAGAAAAGGRGANGAASSTGSGKTGKKTAGSKAAAKRNSRTGTPLAVS